ncbi:MAG: winged helix-turn-helix domain-containing protein, partial [Actinomycetota bacterium]|nr:winged helix-turn-helix domain-containing protein [Actinomycetota bacterium]
MPATEIARVASLLADDTRAAIVAALTDGRARTVGELARHAGVASSTASEHLGRLVDGGLVVVEAQGRHRYHRLAGAEVNDLLERIQGLDHVTAVVRPAARPNRVPAELAHARSCYDHLAGELAVRIHDRLVERSLLVPGDSGTELTPGGASLLESAGVDVDGARRRRRPFVRDCLDWSERRHHLAGALGAALLDAMIDQRWVVRRPTPRALGVTELGRTRLAKRSARR